MVFSQEIQAHRCRVKKKASKASELQRNPKKRSRRKSLKKGNLQLSNGMGETVLLFDDHRLGTACRLQPSIGMTLYG
ncbi:hypothetical protein FGF66_00875 [Chlorobaculum thiosulfatiphilum]|uniref:Uncharacterized protein n=1 Tax=Chlorobaculum thiosulfatiphilum TaxID=115852 RepID=A0A5C4SAP4_CHLTI|nr:hypothetical protein FGF66_00875 [Chlorobaculum thiosulfatiphilum]